MISTAALGQALLALLCYDKERAESLSLRLDPKLFQGRTNQIIARAAVDYIKQYRLPPGDQLELLLENELRRGEEGRLLGQTIDGLFEQYQAVQPEFIITELDGWTRAQLINQAAEAAIEAVARGDVAAAEKAFSLPTTGERKGSQGIWLNDPVGMFRAVDQQSNEFFSSGVDAIDKLGTTPQRKTLTCWMASTGKGKSWALINTLRGAIQYGHTAVYITLELSEEKVAQRLLQALFSLSKSEMREVRVPFFKTDAQGGTTIDFRQLQRDSVLSKRKDIQKRLAEATSWPRILIKEFPTGMLSLQELNLYLDEKEKEGFDPDEIIIDQADNMELDTENLRIATGRLWVCLRGLAVARNAAVITASQGNRESETSKTVDKRHAAEDWSKMGTCDAVYTYSQTAQEYTLGLSRLLVAKYRDETDRVMILNAQSYAIGQFSLDSVIMARGVASEVERLTGGD